VVIVDVVIAAPAVDAYDEHCEGAGRRDRG